MRELGRQKPHIYKEDGEWVAEAKRPLVNWASYKIYGVSPVEVGIAILSVPRNKGFSK